MIINYPTGFYKSVVNNVDNIAEIISSQQPPRGYLYFLKTNRLLEQSAIPIVDVPPADDSKQYGGIMSASRNLALSDMPVRPIGTVIEFSDSYKTTSVPVNSTVRSIEFNNFKDDSIDPVKSKLLKAYREYQSSLLRSMQDIESSKIKLINLEKESNTLTASFDAVVEALAIGDDVELAEIKNDIINKMSTNSEQIRLIKIEINRLSEEKTKIENSIFKISKVLS